MYEWKIRVAKNYNELEKLVEQIQEDGWTIEKIDMASVAVIAYRPKKELLTEEEKGDWGDRDYGQQGLK